MPDRVLAWAVRFPLFALEALGLVLVVLAAVALGRRETGRSRHPLAPLLGLALPRGRAVLIVGITALLARLAVQPALGIPQPYVADEFSNLLAADTFLHGRLANPMHPMWVHFETIHVLMRPTYASMYLPGQGLVLALGKLLSGEPIAGVVFVSAVLCAALCWALQGFLPPGWAFFGGLLAILRLGTFSYWAGSYWGGATAALGGALVVGAVPRLIRRRRPRHAFLLAAGLAILGITRPYEGLLVAVPSLAVLLYGLVRRGALFTGPAMKRIVLPGLAVLVPWAAALATYDRAVTGSPTTLPYRLNRTQYAVARIFLWESPARPEPSYNHAVLRDFFTKWEPSVQRGPVPLGEFVRWNGRKAADLWAFFVGPALTPALLFVPWALARDRRVRPLLLHLVFAAAGFAVMLFWLPAHYAAPMTAVFLILLVQGFRHLGQARLAGRRVGALLVGAVPVLCLGMAGLRAFAVPMGLPVNDVPFTWYSAFRLPNFPRRELVRYLESRPGDHLVLVRYGPDHQLIREWVYNEASIDRARVVFAREMGGGKDDELLSYFRDRSVWLLEPDQEPPRLSRLR